MKAWQVTAQGTPIEVLQRTELQLPAPGAGELRIKVRAAALGFPDVMMCRGNYEYSPALPFTPGQEVVGTVLAAGPDAGFAEGDRVMAVTAFYNGQGGFAEQAMTTADMAYRVPDAMPDLEAAGFLIPFHTAWTALVSRGQIQSGDTLLVLGAAGGSGASAVRLGCALGARVIAVAGGEDKLAYCRQLGAEICVDHRREELVAAIGQHTNGMGVDLVFDPVGGDASERAVECLARAGRLLLIGSASGRWSRPDSRQLLLGNRSVLGVFVGGYSAAERREMHEELLDLYARGRIQSPPGREIGFDEIPAALGAIERREAIGKCIANLDSTQT